MAALRKTTRFIQTGTSKFYRVPRLRAGSLLAMAVIVSGAVSMSLPYGVFAATTDPSTAVPLTSPAIAPGSGGGQSTPAADATGTTGDGTATAPLTQPANSPPDSSATPPAPSTNAPTSVSAEIPTNSGSATTAVPTDPTSLPSRIPASTLSPKHGPEALAAQSVTKPAPAAHNTAPVATVPAVYPTASSKAAVDVNTIGMLQERAADSPLRVTYPSSSLSRAQTRVGYALALGLFTAGFALYAATYFVASPIRPYFIRTFVTYS